ncbi:septation protein SepH [Agromyces aerolatus]|uniref:septation protein SepH n=1 Tax=Agromyces sp. LY-1074 TaxID=3074080 RepID=UPI002855B4C1|nr:MULTISPECIES: septation protein SepH [unclassified Agromyces]MDR5700404.1 septation protein SepH [Agromyces sp. LY-1074]MDR5706618.1 septation protein SepH [Agromyces sp. LY-1358]
MQELTVIGVESGALVATSEDGARFRIEIDEVLQSRIRQATPEAHQGPKLSPREVQAHIRSGMSAEEVAELTGVAVDYVRRFEGPVIAEREHVVTSALAVPVQLAGDLDPADEPASFGSVIRERLAKLGADGERWASWKDEERGWIVKLEFTADTIDHDARWTFDLRRRALQPLNSEAVTLSQQGELKDGLIPRLRAVAPEADHARFDSGAFTFDEPATAEQDTTPPAEPLPYGRPTPLAPLTPTASSAAVTRAAIKRADEPAQTHAETADLLEALRRRRGEREAATGEHTIVPTASAPQAAGAPGAPGAPAANEPEPSLESNAPHGGSPSHPPVDEASADDAPGSTARTLWGGKTAPGTGRARKGRASMPSWDEIVFGARTDDDLA